MKKILSILAAILLIFVPGCSTKEQSTTYVLEKNGVKIELTYYHDGDKVLRQTANNTMNYKEMGATKEKLKEALEPMAKQYQGVEGLEEKIDFQDDKAVETLSIDYKKELKNIPGILIDSTTSDISLKKSEENLLSQGFTKK